MSHCKASPGMNFSHPICSKKGLSFLLKNLKELTKSNLSSISSLDCQQTSLVGKNLMVCSCILTKVYWKGSDSRSWLWGSWRLWQQWKDLFGDCWKGCWHEHKPMWKGWHVEHLSSVKLQTVPTSRVLHLCREYQNSPSNPSCAWHWNVHHLKDINGLNGFQGGLTEREYFFGVISLPLKDKIRSWLHWRDKRFSPGTCWRKTVHCLWSPKALPWLPGAHRPQNKAFALLLLFATALLLFGIGPNRRYLLLPALKAKNSTQNVSVI